MSSIAIDLAAALSTISRPGDFCIAGTADLLAPRLEVEGVGPIALPLLPVQAEQLIATAERAPYGRGEDTLTDTKVFRRSFLGACVPPPRDYSLAERPPHFLGIPGLSR